jgi:nitrogen fixation protein FixH
MKKKSLTDLAKEHGWPTVACKIDKEFEKALVDFLRSSKAPQDTQTVGAHFSKPIQEVEHYLDQLGEQKLARYTYVGRGAWGWVAVPLEHN